MTKAKKIELKAGKSNQIKLEDLEAPIRFILVSGTFTYDVKIDDATISTGTAVASGVVTAPTGCWGTHIKFNCTADGVMYVAYTG